MCGEALTNGGVYGGSPMMSELACVNTQSGRAFRFLIINATLINVVPESSKEVLCYWRIKDQTRN